MATHACKLDSSGARQVFSLQEFFQPRLEEPVLSVCSSAGKGGCPGTVSHLPPPRACSPAC